MFFMIQPPSGGCVLKRPCLNAFALWNIQPPSGGCVLKLNLLYKIGLQASSRLQAAVC